MGRSENVLTEFVGASLLDFLANRQTIWKSELPTIITCRTHNLQRVLYACIRQLALCPCPLCLVKKDDFDKMGQTSDMNDRTNMRRVDSTAYKKRVELSRNFIFTKGKGPDSKFVDNILKGRSETPNRVRVFIC